MLRIAIIDDYHGLALEHLPESLLSPSNDLSVTIFEDPMPPESNTLDHLVHRLSDFDVISTMRERTHFFAPLLYRLPRLKVLLTTGNYNRAIDTVVCRARGIVVAGTPPPPIRNGGTVQHTWALILALADNIPRDHDLITRDAVGWSTASPLNTYLTGKTLAVLGLGKLGRVVARIGLLAFGMDVIAWSANLTQEVADAAATDMGLGPGAFRYVSKDELFRRADVLSIHLVLSARSAGIVSAADLAKMKPSALLCNTSRGPLVDEAALLQVLERGDIRGAALDVFNVEPLPASSPWRTTRWGQDGRAQVILTPHTGYAFEEMMGWMWEHTAENLQRVVDGLEPKWRIDEDGATAAAVAQDEDVPPADPGVSSGQGDGVCDVCDVTHPARSTSRLELR
ncbi:uncharacterized protein EHS24_004539 [Apiotrichum porosum]|uniref:D-isomer specific 2-hydroxyacid dehydrogenase NAD-binding domain-containing protein n=1 Tax=Apiotrichum porosum TaxID=105984 RepID=A0A427Y5D7_9TREE|nr:uncharacterized protein EHS24_004539 [Apiotrichum porosum]RSH86298.1 hypothetical protein EHS24_004539 [Apiotrichum porosum]